MKAKDDENNSNLFKKNDFYYYMSNKGYHAVFDFHIGADEPTDVDNINIFLASKYPNCERGSSGMRQRKRKTATTSHGLRMKV